MISCFAEFQDVPEFVAAPRESSLCDLDQYDSVPGDVHHSLPLAAAVPLQHLHAGPHHR